MDRHQGTRWRVVVLQGLWRAYSNDAICNEHRVPFLEQGVGRVSFLALARNESIELYYQFA